MDTSAFDSLTPGEAAIVRLLAHARDQKTVARELGLSPETVKTHLRNAREKTGAPTSFSLARAFAAWEASHPFQVIPPQGVDASEETWIIPTPTQRSGKAEAANGDDGAFRERRVTFDHEMTDRPVVGHAAGPGSTDPLRRLLLAGALALIIALVLILAFPLSESFQRLADVIDPPMR